MLSRPRERLGQLVRNPTIRWITLLLLIVIAHVVPRALALRQVHTVDALHFGDMLDHLLNLEMAVKLRELGPEAAKDPYLARHPAVLWKNPARWTLGVYLLASLWAGHFGVLSIWTTQLTNLVFSVVLLGGVILLGTATAGLRTGLWAALLATLCPPLVASSWFFNLDYPLTAMTVMGLALLWHTKGFTRPWPSLAFGLWSGLGILVKISYPLYMLAPSLVVLVDSVRQPQLRRRAVVGLTLALSATLVLAPCFVRTDLPHVWFGLWTHFHAPQAAFVAAVEPLTAEWFLALPCFLLMGYTIPLALLCLPGFYLLHRRGNSPPTRQILLGYLWGVIVVLTLMDNKLERYLHPMYPVLCLLTVWWVTSRISRRWQSVGLIWIATVFASMLVLVHEYPCPWTMGMTFRLARPMFYDLRMPSRAELDRSRHRPAVESRLADSLADLAGADRSRRPLGVTTIDDLDRSLQEIDGGRRIRTAILIASRRVRDRLILAVNHVDGEPLPPSVVVIHRPERNPETVHSELRPVARCSVEIEGKQLLLSLFTR